MPRLASKELTERLQSRVEEYAYGDLAYYFRPQSATTNLNEYGQPTEVVERVKVPCSLNDSIGKRRSTEAWTEAVDIAKLDAEIRFGPDVIEPEKGGKFLLVQKDDNPEFGDVEYEIVGIQNRGNFGYLCALHRIEV